MNPPSKRPVPKSTSTPIKEIASRNPKRKIVHLDDVNENSDSSTYASANIISSAWSGNSSVIVPAKSQQPVARNNVRILTDKNNEGDTSDSSISIPPAQSRNRQTGAAANEKNLRGPKPSTSAAARVRYGQIDAATEKNPKPSASSPTGRRNRPADARNPKRKAVHPDDVGAFSDAYSYISVNSISSAWSGNSSEIWPSKPQQPVARNNVRILTDKIGEDGTSESSISLSPAPSRNRQAGAANEKSRRGPKPSLSSPGGRSVNREIEATSGKDNRSPQPSTSAAAARAGYGETDTGTEKNPKQKSASSPVRRRNRPVDAAIEKSPKSIASSPAGRRNRPVDAAIGKSPQSSASSPEGRRNRPVDAAIEKSPQSSASSPAGRRNRPVDAAIGKSPQSSASSPAGRRNRPVDAAIGKSPQSSASSPAGRRNRPVDAAIGKSPQSSASSPAGRRNRPVDAAIGKSPQSSASSPAGRRNRPVDAAIENSPKSIASSPAGRRNRPPYAATGTGSDQQSPELYTSSPLRTRRQLEIDNEKNHPSRPKPSGSPASTTSLPTKTAAKKGNRSMQLKQSTRNSTSFTVNKKSKLRPSEQHIRYLQTTVHLLIPKLSFHRLIRECAANIGATDFRFTVESLGALQETAESYLIGMFEDSYLLALHAKRKTLLYKDMVLARRIRGDSNY